MRFHFLIVNTHLRVLVEYLHKERSDRAGPKFVKQNGVQIISIQKTQVLTTHESNICIIVEFLVKQDDVQIER